MTEVREPTVSVHGVPQSQYNAGGTSGVAPAPVSGGGGIMGHLQRNWPMYALGVGLLTIIVMIYLKYSGGGGSAYYSGSGQQSSTDPNAQWGSQLDADYQQMISSMNQLIALQQGGGSGNNKPATKHYASIKYGETLQQFAEAHGFASWQTLYNEFGNAQTIQKKLGNKQLNANTPISSLFGLRLRTS